MEIQQSPHYTTYITSLGWQVETIDNSHLFIKQFPFFGGFAKLQRTTSLPDTHRLLSLMNKYNIKRLSIEPDSGVPQKKFSVWLERLRPHISLVTTPYISTKTIRVDLKANEQEIFERFTEAKRRAVRRAIKHHVLIKESSDIHVLITTKNTSAGFMGFITTFGIDKLWHAFAPDHTAILLAFAPSSSLKPVGGVLLLFWDTIAYYWIAGATHEGKKLFAPTILVWEALKLAKKRGAKQFDFVGVWDERLPKENAAWKGFTKFKEGFGGKSLYYPLSSIL